MPVSISGSGPITGLTSIASPTTINGLTIPTTGFGKVLQVVSVAFPGNVTMSSGTWTNLSGWSLTITPSAASSKFLCLAGIEVAMLFPNGNVYNTAYARIARTLSGTDTAVATDEMYCQQTGGPYISSMPMSMSLVGIDTPNTTSTLTYKIQGGRATSDIYFYGRGGNALVVMEIAA